MTTTPAYLFAHLEVSGRRFAGFVELMAAAERGELGRCGLIFGCVGSGRWAGVREPAGRFVTIPGGTVVYQGLEPADGPEGAGES